MGYSTYINGPASMRCSSLHHKNILRKMPLLTHKKNPHGADHGVDYQPNPHAGTGLHNPAPPVTTNAPAQGQNLSGVGSGYNSTPAYPNYPGNNSTGLHTNDPYTHPAAVDDPNLAPTGHFSSGQRSGIGSRMAGKMEHVVGTLVGSQALKAKGLQKEQESKAYKAQSVELAEAERLEKEAMLRRERAVQYGAHPSNKPLGGSHQQSLGTDYAYPSNPVTGPTGSRGPMGNPPY